ncbi:zinc-binding protein A33-like [Oncorhynchus tshawytscha]|uniref:zinc-binding protein A33-like n=1 Tax=Oncorhynchus tshawytscha TaxID=74940 RepID=UPI001C3C8DE9|nr:zinc-binding protein A33-like [Oncorhynchus tshawytscha]
MSTSSNVLSEEQFLCSICLDVFTDPVSIPCGHNFCKACISEYWNTTALCQCPLCKDTFNRRPDLKTNTTLRDVADHFKRMKVSGREESSSKPGEVAQVQQMIQERQDPELRRLRQWSVDVTLDPDTAHCKLIVSEDRKQVSYGDVRQILPDLPERFECYLSVLGKEGFSSGRFYFEVQVRGKIEWQVGVARESIIRKGPTAVSPEGGLWALYMNRNKYIAEDTHHIPRYRSQKPQKVGVFVDYKEGQIFFYDVENMSHIYSFTGCTFTEKLYPYLNPCDNEEGSNSAPLVISPVNHID